MHIPKTTTCYLLTAVLTLALAACDDDEGSNLPGAQSYPAVITAQQFGIGDDSQGTTYTKGETIGVYMLESGTDNIVPPYSNLRYYANRYDDQDYFLPGSNDSIPYFPVTGEQRDIAAYYPRTTVLADSLVGIHLAEDYDFAASLLWARANGLHKDNRKAILQLRPALTLLTFTLKAGYGVDANELKGAQITLRNMPVSGHVNVLNGHVRHNEGITADIMLANGTTQQTSLRFQTFVMPAGTTQGYTMLVDVPALGQTYEYEIAAGAPVFDGSTEYEFDTTINDDGMLVSVQSSPITNWGQSGAIGGAGEEVTE